MKTRKNKPTMVLVGLLVALLTLTVSCEEDPPTSVSENVVTETRDVEGFHSISAAIVGGKILLTQGPIQEIELEARPDILYDVETTVIDGVLEIKFDGSTKNENVDHFTARITIPDIRSLTLSGVGGLIAQNDLHTEDLIINRTGVSNVSLRGEAQHLEIISTGVGNVNAFDMTSKSCTILSEGFGAVKVTVTEDLLASISGFCTVFYKGHPSISSNISGTGRLINAN